MFTGLIQDVGTVEDVDPAPTAPALRIATALGPEIALGDSVAVDGICLTATAVDAAGFETEAMNQTLEVTALGDVEAGARVNLELAMRASDRLGGHIVQGHVDGVGEVAGGRGGRLRPAPPRGARRRSCCATPSTRARSRSSGVSLTIADLGESWVAVSLIPETLERTNLGELGRGAS